MSAIEKLRRPSKGASRHDRVTFVTEFRAALDKLQVAPGDEFLVASHARIAQPSLLDTPGDNPLP